MKVVLLKEVPKLGRKNDVKEVSDGYAANFLFPRKLAEPATAALIAKIGEMSLKSAAQEKVSSAFFAKHLRTLEETPVVLYGKANEQGHLFAGIHKEAVLSAIWEKVGPEFPKEALLLDKAIRTTGITKIPVEAHGQKGFVTVEVKGN